MGPVELPETALSRVIDGVLSAIGHAGRWIWLVLMLVVVFNVALRYLFGEGRVELEETQWHLNAVGFLIAIAYGYRVDAHIRIDLVSLRMPPRTRVWVELYGTLFLFLPFIAMLLVFALPFVAMSYEMSEVSQSPGGLPLRWLIKGVLPAILVLLLLAMLSRLSRLWRYLTETAA